MGVFVVSNEIVETGFVLPEVGVDFLVFHDLVRISEVEGIVHFDDGGVVFHAELFGAGRVNLLVCQVDHNLVKIFGLYVHIFRYFFNVFYGGGSSLQEKAME